MGNIARGTGEDLERMRLAPERGGFAGRDAVFQDGLIHPEYDLYPLAPFHMVLYYSMFTEIEVE
ncbi:MAG: hypothetical protein BAA02_10160 [Paenibacillaceae bacterium ZCTH02-B3]|nr:MAG: hypothetical protein BAA02_10160 [Paenibacillaceae bacterium ZCTH02-B3]